MDTFFDELSRLGSGESANNGNGAHTRIRKVHWKDTDGPSEETSTSDSTSSTSERFRGAEPHILPQGRNRARRARRVRPSHTPRKENRPGRGNRSSPQSPATKRSRQTLPPAMDQVPQRTIEPPPYDGTSTTEQEISDDNSTLRTNRSRKESQSQDSIPFSVYSSTSKMITSSSE